MLKHFITALFLFSSYSLLRTIHKRNVKAYFKRDEEARKRYSEELNQPTLQDILSKSHGAGRISFLQTKRPTESIPENLWKWLSEPERLVLRFKKRWITSKYAQELADIVDRVHDDPGRKDNPISNAVLLGVGSLLNGKINVNDIQQFVLFSQIVAHLALREPDILNNIFVQDPDMDQAWRELFENHGCSVVDHPAGFEHVDSNTFLFPAFLPFGVLQDGLRDRPTGEIPMLMMNPIYYMRRKITLKYARPFVLCSMMVSAIGRLFLVLGGGIFNIEDHWTGIMWGIWRLSIWWRAQRSEEKFFIRYDAALKLGFLTGIEDFRQAYDSGLSDTCFMHEQEKLVYCFIAARRFGKAPTFARYFLKYKEGTLREDEKYEEDFIAWQAIVNDPEKQRDRTWMEFLEGDVETYPLDAAGLEELKLYQILNGRQ